MSQRVTELPNSLEQLFELEIKSKSSENAAQLAAGQSKSCVRIKGNPSTNWCGRATVRERKSFQKVAYSVLVSLWELQ